MNEAVSHIGVLLHDFRLGGSERIAIRLARAWAARGRKVTLFVGESSGPLRDLPGPAISMFVCDRQPTGRNIRNLAHWAATAAADAGVGAMFLPGNSYFEAIAVLQRRGLPVFAKLSNPIVRPDRSALRNLCFCLLTARRWRGLCGLVVCSQGEAAEIRRQIKLHIPLTVIANPILDAMPANPGVQKVPGQLCAVGRLEPQKNYPLLLEAFALLRDLPLTLHIAGDGSLRHDLERLVARLAMTDRVEFLGAVQDARPLMAQSEALLLSSDYEGFPAVCVEAISCGTYVVARDGGAGVREALRMPGTGTIVTANTPQALADAVRSFWWQRGFDKVAARAVAENHLIGPIAERYLPLLDTAAN